MDIIQENNIVPYDGTAVALGNFDGLHAAHTSLIRSGVKYAKEHGLKSGILLFNENTKSVLEGRNIRLITPNDEKIRLINGMGVDFTYTVSFNREFMKKTPEEFISFLSSTLKVKAVFVGYDYKFGVNASGKASALEELGRKYGFKTLIFPEMKIDGTTVSSTHIRAAIEDGRMEEATKFLGREFSVCGTVERGFQNGRKMGFPTANISYSDNTLIPRTGVYAGFAYVNDKRFKSVINIGNNPTFGADKITIESHIIGFDDDIYGESIRVAFVKRIRGDRKFGSIEELTGQIEKDIKTAENILL